MVLGVGNNALLYTKIFARNVATNLPTYLQFFDHALLLEATLLQCNMSLLFLVILALCNFFIPEVWNLIRCEFTFCETLCSQALLLMKNEFGYGHWLGEEDCLSCQGGLFWASSLTEFSANGGVPMHMPMRMCKEEFHHCFLFNPRQLTPVKTVVLPINTNFFP